MRRPDEERDDDGDLADRKEIQPLGLTPALLVLRPDALSGFRSDVDEQYAEIETWEHVSTSADFERS